LTDRGHRIPASRVVTIARAPLLSRRDGARKHLIWGNREAEYFSGQGWTTQISLNHRWKFAPMDMGMLYLEMPPEKPPIRFLSRRKNKALSA
jgi:hypothetical protein